MKLIKEIEKHINSYYDYNSFFKAYSFTNENISSYLPYFNLKNKSLLTVGSSCDQVFNASYEGCEDITVCDICPLTESFYHLKLATLLSLNREDFLKFLCETYLGIEHNPYLLNKEIYNKIKNNLKSIDYDSYYIWDYLFNSYDKYDLERLFKHDMNVKEDIIYCNNYLKSNKNYKRLKSLIMNTNVNFINGSVVNEKYNRTFDNIWLSNVVHYLSKTETNILFQNNEKALSDNGTMLLCYIWKNYMNSRDKTLEELNKYNTDRIIILGTNVHEDNSIVLYKKHKIDK